MSKISGYLTTKEIKEMFGWGRAQVSATAKRESWPRKKVGTSYLYDNQEILEYRDARYRTELLKKAGWWSGPGLYRDNEIDVLNGCSVCQNFAIEDPETGEKWICLEGHTGTSADIVAKMKEDYPE